MRRGGEEALKRVRLLLSFLREKSRGRREIQDADAVQ